jgi:hypothetical protein
MRSLHSELIQPCSALDTRWELVQRVAASQLFAKGPKLRAFLVYVCENCLQGQPENLTAQLIGTRVFGRNPDYDPSEDNIVRVEARELRKRLTAYFATEGRDEPVVIEIPKGGYLPVFLPREPETTPKALGTDLIIEPAAESVSTPARSRLVPALFTSLAVAIGIIVWLAASSPVQKQRDVFLSGLRQPGSAAANFSIYDDLLGQLGANPGRDALLVLSNPQLITYFGSDKNLDPTGSSGLSIPIPPELKSKIAPALRERDQDFPFKFFHVTNAGYTGIGETVAAFHIGRLMNLLGRRVRLTQGRFLNWDHVDKQDLILLGGPHSNDWSYQSDTNSNFEIIGNSVVNMKPLPGEEAVYKTDQSTDYAIIKRLRTPYDFETLLIAGISNAGTAAAGEFLTNPYKVIAAYRTIRGAAADNEFPPNWEILIKVAVREGVPLDSSVIATRPGTGNQRK